MSVKRFGDLNTKAFPEVEKHLSIEEVRAMGDFTVKDHSEPMKMKDDKGIEKDVVIVLGNKNGQDFTFSAGSVVMEKVTYAKNNGILPLTGKIELVKGKSGNKYNDII